MHSSYSISTTQMTDTTLRADIVVNVVKYSGVMRFEHLFLLLI